MKSTKFLRKIADQTATILKLAETAANGKEIADTMNLSNASVYKVLKENKISLNNNIRNRIIEYSKNSGETIDIIADKLGFSRERIRQILRDASVEIVNDYFVKDSEINDAIAKLKFYIDDLIKNGKFSMHGCPPKDISSSIIASLRRKGFSYSKEFQTVRDNKILEMSNTMTPAKISRITGLSYNRTLDILHKNGKKKSLTRIVRNKSIRKDIDNGMSIKDIAKKYNVSRETVSLVKGSKRKIPYKS